MRFLRSALLVVALACLSLLVSAQVSNPPTRLYGSAVVPDGGCSGSYAAYADAGMWACSGGHYVGITSGGGSSAATSVTGAALPPAISPSGSDSYALVKDTSNTGSSYIFHWNGSAWSLAGSTVVSAISDTGSLASSCTDFQLAVVLVGGQPTTTPASPARGATSGSC